MKEKSKEELVDLLYEALEIIWYMETGYHKQKEAKAFMEKCNYDFYKRPKQ